MPRQQIPTQVHQQIMDPPQIQQQSEKIMAMSLMEKQKRNQLVTMTLSSLTIQVNTPLNNILS